MWYRTRQCNKILLNVKHYLFKNTFFPSTLIEWNKWDGKIKILKVLKHLRKKFYHSLGDLLIAHFNCHNPKGIKLLSRHSFQDSLDPFCSCGRGEVEASCHYLLHYSNYSPERLTLLNPIKNIDMSILQQNDLKCTSVFFFGDTSFDNNKNTLILEATMLYYINSTGRFDDL